LFLLESGLRPDCILRLKLTISTEERQMAAKKVFSQTDEFKVMNYLVCKSRALPVDSSVRTRPLGVVDASIEGCMEFTKLTEAQVRRAIAKLDKDGARITLG
jgi:hypothetical protein